jgi:hypothetical protein
VKALDLPANIRQSWKGLSGSKLQLITNIRKLQT